ncbi:MAG: universal stress protein [bacterium]|nr:universal stress protein UspA [Deltaproteobacteria bacterium]MCP4907024.1 universal stress protein [bacterium]
MKIETVLAATDFSEAAGKAMKIASDLARHFEAELVVVHAYNVEIPIASPMVEGGYILPSGFFEQISKQATLQVEEAANQIVERGVSATGIAIDEPAALAIVDEAQRRSADIIVMGTRGLTGLKHIALGSVADKVVRTAHCPVLTVGENS